MKQINYQEFYKHVYDKEWNGWKELIDIMNSIEQKGSISKKHPESRVLHALEFLNNHFVEEKVKQLLELEYLGDDHNVLYDKVGDKGVPDFIDSNNETYELKSRWNFDDINKIYWNDADHKLLYLKRNNTLYEIRKDGNFPLGTFRARFVNIKDYPFRDEDFL